MDVLICILSIMILTRPKVCRSHSLPDVTAIDNFILLIHDNAGQYTSQPLENILETFGVTSMLYWLKLQWHNAAIYCLRHAELLKQTPQSLLDNPIPSRKTMNVTNVAVRGTTHNIQNSSSSSKNSILSFI